jgi:phage terminase small subunit
MPVLKNAKHERFAQGIAEGMSGADAYLWAGYASNANAAAVSATRLLKDAKVKARVAELLKRREDIEVKATEKAVNKLAISKERILSELAKIGFADIRRAVKWNGLEIKEEDAPDGGDTLVIKHTYANNVLFLSSDEIDDETAGAIAEVSQTPTGGLKIKLHDKRAALVDMGKHLGLFKEIHEHTGPGGGPVQLQRIERVIVDPADTDSARVPPASKAKALSRR